MSSPSAALRTLLTPPDERQIFQEAIQFVDDRFSSWDDLVGSSSSVVTRKGKKRMTLDEEIQHWEGLEREHSQRVRCTDQLVLIAA